MDEIRTHFPAIMQSNRICTNNAASTQIPQELLDLNAELFLEYENVHRGQSQASQITTRRFEEAYEKIAACINADDWRSIILYRGTTEAINAVMYSLLTEFESGDNIVLTYLEHNSNYVPWYGLCREIAPRFNIDIEYRLVAFDKKTGELDLDDFRDHIDEHTKLVCCTGASNFLGTKPPLKKIISMARKSGYEHATGAVGSYVLIDGANLVPNASFDVQKLDVDFLAWSFHKMLAPVAVGGLYVRSNLLETLRPFQYGGDMIAEGMVTSEQVQYTEPPWRYTAGTPNIIGTILAGAVIDLIPRLVLEYDKDEVSYRIFRKAMKCIQKYEQTLTQFLLDELTAQEAVDYYGPLDASRKTPLVSFNINGQNPMDIAKQLDHAGIEVRAGCHCATLAHHYLGLQPPASCRISPYFYNTQQEMEYITKVLREILSEKNTRSVQKVDSH